jgi:2-oxoacid:acceptor oxidoreductase gamma subunit (pyruvate/2-ketoisovalerate family)
VSVQFRPPAPFLIGFLIKLTSRLTTDIIFPRKERVPVNEIRIHGRGGQGSVLAARMLATAFVAQGQYVASFPMYGFERRGAPVVAFTRVDNKPITIKSQIYEPNCLVVIDPGLMRLPTLFAGLKPGGILIVNTNKEINQSPNPNLKIMGIVDATKIAIDEIGRDVPNTCLLGAFAAATGWLELQSITEGLGDYFEGNLFEKNVRSAQRGYYEVKIKKWE